MITVPNIFGGSTSKPRKKKMRYKVVVGGTTIRKSSKKALANQASKGIRGARVLPINASVRKRRAKTVRRRKRRTTRRRRW